MKARDKQNDKDAVRYKMCVYVRERELEKHAVKTNPIYFNLKILWKA